jgi:hypothetical protein
MHVNGILLTAIGKDQHSMCWFLQNTEVPSGVYYAEFYQNGTVNVGSTSTSSLIPSAKYSFH